MSETVLTILLFGLQIMQKVLPAHYISPMYTFVNANGEYRNPDWSGLVSCLKIDFPNVFNDHLLKYYFNEDPRFMGGRCAGLAGQNSSTNGLEKRGGNVKSTYASLTQHVPKKNRTVIHGMMAFARDIDVSLPSLKQFTVNPKRSEEDYCYPRFIFDYEQKCSNLSNPPNLMYDVLFMMCTSTNDRTVVYDTIESMFEHKFSSFTLRIPTARTIYTLARSHWKNQILTRFNSTVHEMRQSESFVEPRTPSACKNHLKSLTQRENARLKAMLYKNMIEDTHEPKQGESTWSYIRRRCQRNPSGDGCTLRTKNRIAQRKERMRKSIAAQQKKESDKWGSTESTQDPDPKPKEPEPRDQSTFERFCDLPFDDFDSEDLLGLLVSFDEIDEKETETLQMIDEDNEVRVDREHGAWIETTVDLVSKRIDCNCEDHNFDGCCPHEAFVELIVLQVEPPDNATSSADEWTKIRQSCKRVLEKTAVPLLSLEEIDLYFP